MKTSGWIYKYCFKDYCYFGYSTNPNLRKEIHIKNLSTLYQEIVNGSNQIELFIDKSDKLTYEKRYYKMFLVLIDNNAVPEDFTFKIICKSEGLSGGGLIELFFAKHGIFNGIDKKIGLTKKENFWKIYKNEEELWKIYSNWKRKIYKND